MSIEPEKQRIKIYLKLALIYLKIAPKEAMQFAVLVKELDRKNKTASEIIHKIASSPSWQNSYKKPSKQSQPEKSNLSRTNQLTAQVLQGSSIKNLSKSTHRSTAFTPTTSFQHIAEESHNPDKTSMATSGQALYSQRPAKKRILNAPPEGHHTHSGFHRPKDTHSVSHSSQQMNKDPEFAEFSKSFFQEDASHQAHNAHQSSNVTGTHLNAPFTPSVDDHDKDHLPQNTGHQEQPLFKATDSTSSGDLPTPLTQHLSFTESHDSEYDGQKTPSHQSEADYCSLVFKALKDDNKEALNTILQNSFALYHSKEWWKTAYAQLTTPPSVATSIAPHKPPPPQPAPVHTPQRQPIPDPSPTHTPLHDPKDTSCDILVALLSSQHYYLALHIIAQLLTAAEKSDKLAKNLLPSLLDHFYKAKTALAIPLVTLDKPLKHRLLNTKHNIFQTWEQATSTQHPASHQHNPPPHHTHDLKTFDSFNEEFDPTVMSYAQSLENSMDQILNNSKIPHEAKEHIRSHFRPKNKHNRSA